jgi:DnaJ-class molecular chaperone
MVESCICPACDGRGTPVETGTCWRCKGTGVLTGAQAANAMEDALARRKLAGDLDQHIADAERMEERNK